VRFNNDLAGGVTLVRPALQSPDYQTGVSGWAIMIDGSAEFNNVTIRGATQVGGTSLYYSGAPALGNLLLSIAGAAGADEFGNNYVQGLGVYGADGQLSADGPNLTVTGSNGSAVSINTGGAGQANLYLTPRDLGGTTWTPANAYTTLGASNRPGLGFISPYANAHPVGSTVEFYGGGPTTSDAYILFGADRVNFNGDIEVVGAATTYSTWTTFTPQWNNVGTATFSTNIGWWKRVGDMYLFEVYAVASAAGSGTTAVTISGLPFTPFRAGAGAASTRQRVGAHLGGVVAGTNASVAGAFNVLAFAGGAASTLDRLTGPTAIDLRGENIGASFIATIQGWMRST
jgi:hypothetical protein